MRERPVAEVRDQGFDVLDLTPHRVREGVAALTSAAPVVGHGGEVLRQGDGQLGGGVVIAERAADDDDGRSGADRLVGDLGAVRGEDLVMCCVFPVSLCL